MLELQDITKVYKTKSEDVYALNKVNLYFEDKGMVFITGKSGSGKTTLLNVIGGLDSFDEGKLIIKGKSFDEFKQKDFDDYRNTFIGFVFQEYNLLDEMTVEKNIALAMELQGQKADKEKINELLKTVDLEGLNSRHPSELSGGQRQKVAIARAIIKNPNIILTDEPTGALDTKSGIQVMNILKRLSRDKLVIIVSHNMDLAKAYSDRIIEMQDGEVVKDYMLNRDGSAKDINIAETDEQVTIKRGAKLSKNDLETIKSSIEDAKDIRIVDGDKFYVETKTSLEKKNYSAEDTKFIRGRLGFKNNFKLGLTNLKSKPIRLVITIILCAIAFSIFGLFDSMTIYDEARLTANTLKNSNVPSIILTSSMKEDTGNEYNMTMGESLIDDISSKVGLKFKGTYVISATRPNETKSVSYMGNKYYVTSYMPGVIEVQNEKEINGLGLKLKYGRLPEAYDEIAITNFYAMCLINYGYSYNNFAVSAANYQDVTPEEFVKEEPLILTLDKKPYKIVGIIDAGKISSKYNVIRDDQSKASTSLIYEYNNYITNSYNMFGFVKTGFVNNKYKQNGDLYQYKNTSFEFDFDLFSNDALHFLNYEDLNESDAQIKFIDSDQTSLQNNQILINVQTFEEAYAKLISRARNIAKNDEEEKYNDAIDSLDLYLAQLTTTQTSVEEKFTAVDEILEILGKIIPDSTTRTFQLKTTVTKRDATRYEDNDTGKYKEVKLKNNSYVVAGFYAGLGKTVNQKLMALTESGLTNLGVNVKQGPYSSAIAPSTKSSSKINRIIKLIDRSSGLKFESSNNVLNIISVNKDFLNEMSLLFLIASGIFAVFAIAMMANYISTSIANRHVHIGILRALGTSGSDVLNMFLTESVIIAVINILLSNIITGIGTIFLNMFLKNIMNISIPLAIYSLRQFLIISALSIGVAFISSAVPIIRLSKKKPIETIKG